MFKGYQVDFINLENTYPQNKMSRIVISAKLKKNVNLEKLEKILVSLPKVYEALNISIEKHQNEWIKVEKSPVEIPNKKLVIYEFSSYFNLTNLVNKRYLGLHYQGNVYDFFVAKIKDHYYLLIYVSHIICDGIGMMKIIEKIFNSYYDEKMLEMKIEDKSIIDFEKYVESKKYTKDALFWNEKIGELADNEMFKKNTFEIESQRDVKNISKDTYSKMKKICEFYKISNAMLMAIFFCVYKFNRTGIDTTVVACPISTQKRKDREEIGHYVNVLPFKMKLTHVLFSDQIIEFKKNWEKLIRHSSYPLVKINDRMFKDARKADYIDCVVNFIHYQFTENTKKLICDDITWEANVEMVFPLKLTFSDRIHPLLEIDSKSSIYSPEEIVDMWKSFTIFINELGQCDDKLKLNDVRFEREKNLNFVDIFEKLDPIFKENKHEICLIHEENKLTYKQVQNESEKVYLFLKAKGISKQSVIGVYMEKGISVITTLLGIIKAGCIYLPINPEFPEKRINYIIQNSQPKIVIYDCESRSKISELTNSVCLSEIKSIRHDNSFEFVENRIEKSDIVYIIYTSGTTGNPKGVVASQDNLFSLFNACESEFSFKKEDVWMQLHSHAFDFSIWEIFGALFNSSKLIIPNKEDIVSKNKLAQIIKKYNVSILNITPQAFYSLVDSNKKINKNQFKYVVFGGDKLDFGKIKQFFNLNNKTEGFNMYGITEVTVHATIKKIDRSNYDTQVSNIGKSLKNLEIFIINKGELVKNDEVGEIVVSGKGVTRGYLNNPNEFKKKFKEIIVGDKKMSVYFSGDAARYLKNGDIEYLGRLDSIVNIRGYRVGLEEINQAMFSLNLINNVCVLYNQLENIDELVAVVEKNKTIKLLDKELIKKIFQELRQLLPEYMIPNRIILMDKLPLTINGKVDQKKIVTQIYNTNELSIQDEIEEVSKKQVIKNTWKQFLNLTSKVNLKNDFFLDGGDSIKAIQFLSALEELNIYIEFNSFLENPTLEFCFSKIQKFEPENFNNFNKTEELKNEISFLPLISQYLFKNSITNHYIQGISINVPKIITLNHIKGLIEYLKDTHDSLNVVYADIASNYMLFSKHSQNNYISKHWGTIKKENKTMQLKKINIEAKSSISESKLIRVDCFEIDKMSTLIFTFSHLLVDGFSWRILLKSVEQFLFSLQNRNLEVRKQSYKNWIDYEYEDISVDTLITKKIANNCNRDKYKDTVTLSWKMKVKKDKNIIDIDSIFLTSLVKACLDCSSKYEEKISIEKETHNRNSENANIIGWLTRMYTINIQNENNTLLEVYDQIKLLNKPDLKTLEEKFKKEFIGGTNFNNLRFNYLGELDLIDCNLVTFEMFSSDDLVDENFHFQNDLEFNCVLINGEYQFHLRASNELGNQIQTIKENFMDNFFELMEYVTKIKVKKSEIEFLGGRSSKKMFMIPPSMPYFGYSIIYKKLAKQFEEYYEVYMLRHFKSENILSEFIEVIQKNSKEPITLVGYSFGGTIAFEIARALLEKGIKVEKIIMFDSFVVPKNRFDDLELNEEEALEFLIKDFINKKSGKELESFNSVQIDELIEDYKIYHYATKNIYTKEHKIATKVFNFVTKNDTGWNGETRISWQHLAKEYFEIDIFGEHTVIFDSQYFDKNLAVIKKALIDFDERKKE